MLARKSIYRKIKRNFSRFFGHKNKISSQRRVNVSGWRFVFASFIIFSIFAYFFPFSRLLNSIRAFGGHTEKISLYANSIQADEGENFTEGWHNKEKAIGLQNLGPNADMLEFSDENSAFYSGGNYSLVVGDFRFLTEDANKIIEKDQADKALADEQNATSTEQDENMENEIISDEIEEIKEIKEIGEIASGTNIVEENDVQASTSDEAVETSIENSLDIDPAEIRKFDSDIINPETEEQEAVIEEIHSSQEEVKIENVPSRETDAKVIGTEATISEGIVSFLDKIKSFFVGAVANAQSFVSPEIKTLSDLGIFKSAVINLSLAIHSDKDTGDGAEATTDSTESESEQNAENNDRSSVIVWYSLEDKEDEASSTASSTDNRLWQKLDEVRSTNISNALNGGYISFDAPFLESWQDIENLKIKIEAIDGGNKKLIYLDSVWVESVFERETELDKLKQRQRWEEALDVLSDNLIFKAGESGELKFQYNKNEERIWETIGEFFGIGNFWKNVDLRISLIDPSGKETDVALTTIFENDGTFTVRLPDTMEFMPGQYRLQFAIKDSSGEVTEEFVRTQEFYWGVLALNFNKSEYQENEKGFVQMAVLDNLGHTICDAEVNLEVRDASGNIQNFSTTETDETKRIVVSKECGPETVTNVPDYSFYYQFASIGDYEFKLTAKTAAGEKAISEIIAVKDAGVFSVERFGPTRIWPKADYGMKMVVLANNDFSGNIIETVPAGFKIKNYELRITNYAGESFLVPGSSFVLQAGEEKSELVWQNIEVKKGDRLEFTYAFDAPDRSPELYLVGPLKGISAQGGPAVGWENRSWQIASDSFLKRARTVMFQAGVYNDTAGGTGQNTNTDYTLSAFNWKLAESGVTIKNAYIVMEAQFGAYNNTGVQYSGYKLGFDTCVENCSSAAFGTGAGQVLDNNANTFVYDELESNIGRLQLDVTNETQLAAYTGNGALMESQFGYRLKNSSAYSSIANVSAILVLTYTYDIDSPNITNTVVYPLDSTNGTDTGTRQASQIACTADTNCPTLTYNMTLPEWQGVATSSNRISQWFKMFASPSANTTTDVRPYLDIQTYNVDSNVFHFEEALSGQGAMPPMFFPDWSNSGYAENSSQTVEYFTGSTNFAIGGEVFETYQASSSAPEKTRTVSFPMGVIENGNSINLFSKTINVAFPENGSATGTVDIKSAWIRFSVLGHTNSANPYTITTSSKVGDNATSSNQVYNFLAPVIVANPTLEIFYIIPVQDYTELEGATATSSKPVKVNLTYNNAVFNGASAELMITYTYTSEANGYLTNLKLSGGQASTAPATSTILSTASTVFPEATSTSVMAASVNASFLSSDTVNTTTAMGTAVQLIDVNMAIGTPVCTPAYRAIPDSSNMYTEIIDDVSSVLTTTNNQSYNVCYAIDDTTRTTDVAKANGQLAYTYSWINTAPIGSFITASTTAKTDGTGVVDIGIAITDPDNQDVKAKIEFATGTTCDFSAAGDPQLDETDANTTAVFGDPYVLNSNTYQIGTVNGYIKTASGSNSVFFDWQARTSLGEVDGNYCLRLTANDLNLDQTTPATTTVYLDTKKPTVPGPLSLNSRTGTTVTLNLGATTTETNFNEYKIFYKLADGTDPKETDSVWASTSDINLYDKNFGTKATTTINTGLVASTTYSFAIWVYDLYGNKASSTRVDITTNDAPLGSFNKADTKQRTNASGIVDVSIEIDDLNDQNTLKARIDVATGTNCDFSSSIDPDLDENQSNITADFVPLTIENDNTYQVGGPGAWIMTSPGSNTITFDWFSKTNLPNGDATYCLRLITNDSFDDQLQAATTTITIDNVVPTATGPLSAGALTVDSINLVYNIASPGADTNEPSTNAYKIYYKQGTSGATEGLGGETEVNNTDLDAYDFNGATSTLVQGLLENTWYVFKIWTYDAFGNKASSSEVAIKTNAAVNNESLTFSNALSEGPATNIAAAIPGQEWNFRAIVSDIYGWQAISSTTLRLANNLDNTAPYDDLVFRWNQTGEVFTEIGTDANSVAALSANSTSTCSGITCTINFKIVFNKLFTDTNTNYNAVLVSDSDVGVTVENSYPNFYQVRFPYVEQTHYRWRNDDGGD